MDNNKARWLWLFQVVSGMALTLMLGTHWIVQHYLASDGLRSYAEVVTFLKQPIVLTLEIAFLIVVTGHALIGVRAILVDLGPRPGLQRSIDIAFWFVGILTVAYGVQLAWQIIHQ
jgi:succinate dehydrogenase membrane anchor subunit